MKACDSCAGTARDGAVLGRKAHHRSLLCTDCEEEAARIKPTSSGRLITRKAYRAALRHRLGLQQTDLVDLVMPVP